MSKRKQIQTKKNNIQRSDTDPYLHRLYAFFQAVTEDERLRFLFPPTLENKKFKKVESPFGVDDSWQSYLEQYLETKNPDCLIDAIKEKPSLLRGEVRRRNLTYEEYGIKPPPIMCSVEPQSEPDPMYVDGHTIIWETINWWRELYSLHADKPQADEARDYLLKIGHALVPERKERTERSTGDQFIHVIPHEEGQNSYLTYKSVYNFIQYWDRVKGAFKSKNNRYKTINKSVIDEMPDEDSRTEAILYKPSEWAPKIKKIKQIIKNKLDDEIPEIEIYERFNLSDVSTITASYIAWKHEKACPICKEQAETRKTKKVGYKTIQRLYKDAKQKLKLELERLYNRARLELEKTK